MNQNELIQKVGKVVKEIRLEKNMTQSDISDKIGKDRQSYQRIELAKVNCTIGYLNDVCNGFGITLEELFTRVYES